MNSNRDMNEFERWASGLASTAMGTWGLKRGGLFGILALAGAGLLAWRMSANRSLLALEDKRPAPRALPAADKPRRTRRASATAAKTRKAAPTRRPAAAKTAVAKSATAKSAAAKPATTRAKAKPATRRTSTRTPAEKAPNSSASTH
ncbi:hypothetical protein ABLE91_23565 [Aquabacter sp. CN5-332]|uniref:hypothetical protein n=1 Tax=Aquabacter sp. CN5-332 TaxID=3156608 RepID=UPI0032B3C012